MPWARLSDDFYDHPKVESLARSTRLACVGLHILAISWSNRFLTDGVVPEFQIRKLGGTPVQRDALITAGLWDRLVDGVAIHDFHDYNPSKADILADRQAARERMARARRSRHVRANSDDADANGSGEHEANSIPLFGRSSSTRPDPSRPVPTESRPAAAAVRKNSVPRAEGET